MLPTILRTPLEIYDAIKQEFPNAHVDIENNGETAKMKIVFGKDPQSIYLDKAVDSRAFIERLHTLKLQFFLHGFSSEKPLNEFNVKTFSNMESLSEWQQFRRVLYESQGFRCTDVILDYLINPNLGEKQLYALGLAPEQVENDVSNQTYRYFQEIETKLDDMTDSIRSVFISQFQKKYPSVWKRFLHEIVRKKFQEGLGKKDIDYEITLNQLRACIFGQKHAAEKVAAILTSQKNRSQSNRVFLFVGPTGVGKTELAKAISRFKKHWITLPMNQYPTEMDIGRFFGSGPGLVGSTDKSEFAKAIDSCSPQLVRTEESKEFYEIENAVILFDELEKAHPTIKQSLLSLFDEGYCRVGCMQHHCTIQFQK